MGPCLSCCDNKGSLITVENSPSSGVSQNLYQTGGSSPEKLHSSHVLSSLSSNGNISYMQNKGIQKIQNHYAASNSFNHNSNSQCYGPSQNVINQPNGINYGNYYNGISDQNEIGLVNSNIMYQAPSVGNLQHISEREPDDFEMDPSLNPTKQTLFLSRSINDVEQTIKKRRSFYEKNHSRRYQTVSRRFSSCGTVLLDDSTVSRPNAKSIVRALSLAVYYQIRNRDRTNNDEFNMRNSPAIFDERLHPLQKEPIPSNYSTCEVDFRLVYRFIRTLFQLAQLSPECAVVTMVYLERLLTSAEIELYPGNWKRILLCCILLASKVWDDQAVWNVDYCQILRDLKVDDVNELERQFLEIIQFNINVPASVYAKYYFDIRALSDSIHLMPLSRDRAYKLEAISRIVEDPFKEMLISSGLDINSRKWGSLDTITQPPRFQPAMIP